MFDEDDSIALYMFEDRKNRQRLIGSLGRHLSRSERSAAISDITFMPMKEVMERLPNA
ncbi:hypothetical protein [Ralstonia phage RSP15]|uniref:hypothetical protein n=1 Tax=Ralstonia phage RSP15 TaxID=1785960 RepID=UPI00074D306A|nr:hypothetical protein BH754_gp060 [Ralstonia phage RSP15]BAU40018.1 hypothetical protein [Ralstonia phage RSP15]